MFVIWHRSDHREPWTVRAVGTAADCLAAITRADFMDGVQWRVLPAGEHPDDDRGPR